MVRKPKYRRHVGRDRGFVEFQGKRHYLRGAYKSPESLAAYREFLDRYCRPARIIGDPKPTTPSVAHVAYLFLAWAEDTYPAGPRSEYANCRAAINHLGAAGDLLAIEYGPLKLKELQARMANAQKTRTYINAVVGRIKRMFKWAASEELIPANVYHALQAVSWIRKGRTPAKEPVAREPVEWQQVAAVLAELSPTVRAMVLAQWFTGVRSGSLCQARPEQFKTTCQPWEWRPRHKMEHEGELVVFVGPQCQKVLAPLLKGKRPGDYLFQPRHLNGKRAKNFRSFYDSTSYQRAVSRAIARVGVSRWTPHQLRHARGTLVRAKHGLEAAQASLGHKALDATQIYARKQMDLARRVAKQMG